ncbi:MAG: hypothetical protein N2109_11060 [Fimbriimonadales bacterium]|nr:hypothetical protein [Fimbriimonadales bacterium]
MKISPYVFIVIGVSLALVVLSFGVFHFYLPNMKNAQYQKELADKRQQIVDQAKRAERRVEDALKLREEKTSEWRRIVAARTPPASVAAGGIDISVNPWQLAIDARKFRNSVQEAVNRQVKRGGVKVISGPLVPFPEPHSTGLLASYFNFPAIPFPVVIFDLGTVTVQGTYEQITANVRAWRNMPGYLAVVDGLAFTGTSPILTGTYQLTLVGYIRGQQLFGNVNEAGGTGTGGFGGGSVGGPPTGFGAMFGPPGAGMGGPPGGIPMGPPSGLTGGAVAGGERPPAPSAAPSR